MQWPLFNRFYPKIALFESFSRNDDGDIDLSSNLDHKLFTKGLNPIKNVAHKWKSMLFVLIFINPKQFHSDNMNVFADWSWWNRVISIVVANSHLLQENNKEKKRLYRLIFYSTFSFYFLCFVSLFWSFFHFTPLKFITELQKKAHIIKTLKARHSSQEKRELNFAHVICIRKGYKFSHTSKKESAFVSFLIVSAFFIKHFSRSLPIYTHTHIIRVWFYASRRYELYAMASGKELILPTFTRIIETCTILALQNNKSYDRTPNKAAYFLFGLDATRIT